MDTSNIITTGIAIYLVGYLVGLVLARAFGPTLKGFPAGGPVFLALSIAFAVGAFYLIISGVFLQGTVGPAVFFLAAFLAGFTAQVSGAYRRKAVSR